MPGGSSESCWCTDRRGCPSSAGRCSGCSGPTVTARRASRCCDRSSGSRPTTTGPAGFDEALGEVAEWILGGCRVWRAWRLTPSGGCPGPVPHPVVLVEFAADPGLAPEVLAYRVADALLRSGYLASVEVFTTSMALPENHPAAV